MENTVARFEFRIFGNQLKSIEELVNKTYENTQIKESSEIYILSKNTNTNNCKIRHDLLDIKQLISSFKDLEQWIPKLKVSFPISVEIMQFEIFKYLCVDMPPFEHTEYSYDLFIEEIVKKHPDLRIVHVTKQRQGYIDKSCTIEVAQIEVNGLSQTTIGIESLYVEEIQKNRKLLGLKEYKNENYVQALKRLTS